MNNTMSDTANHKKGHNIVNDSFAHKPLLFETLLGMQKATITRHRPLNMTWFYTVPSIPFLRINHSSDIEKEHCDILLGLLDMADVPLFVLHRDTQIHVKLV